MTARKISSRAHGEKEIYAKGRDVARLFLEARVRDSINAGIC